MIDLGFAIRHITMAQSELTLDLGLFCVFLNQ